MANLSAYSDDEIRAAAGLAPIPATDLSGYSNDEILSLAKGETTPPAPVSFGGSGLMSRPQNKPVSGPAFDNRTAAMPRRTVMPPAVDPEAPSFGTDVIGKTVADVGSAVKYGAQTGLSGLLSFPAKIGMAMGDNGEGLVKTAADYYKPTEAQTAEAQNFGTGQKILAGAVDAPFTIAKYAPATTVAGPIGGFAITDALDRGIDEQGNVNATEMAKGAAMGATMGGVLHYINKFAPLMVGKIPEKYVQMLPKDIQANLNKIAGAIGVGTVFGGQSAMSGGNASDITSGAVLGAAFGWMGGKGRAIEEKIARNEPLTEADVVDIHQATAEAAKETEPKPVETTGIKPNPIESDGFMPRASEPVPEAVQKARGFNNNLGGVMSTNKLDGLTGQVAAAEARTDPDVPLEHGLMGVKEGKITPDQMQEIVDQSLTAEGYGNGVSGKDVPVDGEADNIDLASAKVHEAANMLKNGASVDEVKSKLLKPVQENLIPKNQAYFDALNADLAKTYKDLHGVDMPEPVDLRGTLQPIRDMVAGLDTESHGKFARDENQRINNYGVDNGVNIVSPLPSNLQQFGGKKPILRALDRAIKGDSLSDVQKQIIESALRPDIERMVNTAPEPARVEQRTNLDIRQKIDELQTNNDWEGAKKLIEQARKDARTDQLTGLPNARAWAEDMPKAVAEGKTVWTGDVAGMKYFNDTFGHQAGDQLLQHIAQQLKDADVNAYRYKIGDELAGFGKTPEELADLQRRIENGILEVETEDGKIRYFTGVRFDYGHGQDIKTADAEFYNSRAAAETAGTRNTERGGKPYGLRELTPEELQDSQSFVPPSEVVPAEAPPTPETGLFGDLKPEGPDYQKQLDKQRMEAEMKSAVRGAKDTATSNVGADNLFSGGLAPDLLDQKPAITPKSEIPPASETKATPAPKPPMVWEAKGGRERQVPAPRTIPDDVANILDRAENGKLKASGALQKIFVREKLDVSGKTLDEKVAALKARYEYAMKLKEEQPQGAPSGFASADPFADTPNETPGPEAKDKTRLVMDMPEIVEMAHDLLGGKYPELKNAMGRALGRFYAQGEGRIALRKSLFADPLQAAKTLAHEIGHLVDYLPENTLKRGNILGRVASLKEYMKHMIQDSPKNINELLTDKDKARLRREAELTAKDEANANGPLFTNNLQITPEDIRKIWTDVDARTRNRPLYDFIAGLDGKEKKSILRSVMGGEVPEAVKKLFSKKQGGETLDYANMNARSKEIFHDLLRKEIEKRRLFTLEEMTKELKTLTQTVKPFDETRDVSYTKYRFKSSELYADAISTLINDPAMLKRIAPKFYDGFFNYMERKPEVAKIYEDIQNRIADESAIYNARQENIREGFARGEEALKKQEDSKLGFLDSLKNAFVDSDGMIKDLAQKAESDGNLTHDQRAKLLDAIGASKLNGARVAHYVREMMPVMDTLKADGLTHSDLGELLLYEHIAENRKEIANAYGTTPEAARFNMRKMEEKLGAKKMSTLRDAANKFWETRQNNFVQMAEDSKTYSPEIIQMMKDRARYAHMEVVDYMEQDALNRAGRGGSTKIFRQEGSLRAVGNPFTQTILNDIKLMRGISRNNAAREVVKTMDAVSPQLLTPAKSVFGGKGRGMIYESPKDSDLGMIGYYDNGKYRAFYTNKLIANDFEKDPAYTAMVFKISKAINAPMRELFVQKNLPFWAANYLKDYMATVQHLPGNTFVKDFPHAVMGLGEAFKFAHGMKTQNSEAMLKRALLIMPQEKHGMATMSERETNYLKELGIGAGDEKPGSKYHKIIEPVLNEIDRMSRTFEWANKFGGFRYLNANQEKLGLSETDINRMTRELAGSPEFMTKGRKTSESTGVLLLFYNANVQGIRQSIMAAREHPVHYGWTAMKAVAMPTILAYAAAQGIFGDHTKKVMDGVSDYDKRNYNIVPLGLDDNGNSVFLRLPLNHDQQFIHGLIWGALNTRDLGGVQKMLGGAVANTTPGVTPVIGAIADMYQYYIEGQNPYDNFRGRQVIPDTEYQAGGWRSQKIMLKYLAGQVGLKGFINFKRDDLLEKPESTLEKAYGLPVIGPLTKRFLSTSDIGITEQLRDASSEMRTNTARTRLDMRDRVVEGVNRGEAPFAVFKDLRANNLIPEHTTLTQFRHTYDRYKLRKRSNPYIDAVLFAPTNDEKRMLLKKYQEDLPKDDFMELRNELRKAGALPRHN